MQPQVVNGPKEPTDWNNVQWRRANRQVRNLRQRIFRASQQGDWKRVHSLQTLMLRSYSNRLTAVRKVTQVNQGKRTAGVDKVLVKTPKARGQLVDELATYQPWKAKPAKRVYIPKASGKLRPLGIPTIRDRALQAMVKNALEPSWEARFEGCSYGFRPGRSCHDAIQYVWTLTNARSTRRWVLDADIEGAFDNIDHNHLLQVIGEVPGRELIKQWLKAGYVEKLTWNPTDSGTPQGGVISPLLANIALHGMEEALGIRWRPNSRGDRKNLSDRALVRYADDFVVICKTKEDAEAALLDLETWLAQRGLRLSKEKTRVVHITEGFDFLGFNIRLYRSYRHATGQVLMTKPSKASVSKLRKRLKDDWKSFHGVNARVIVKTLNPVIRGWANYFRIGASARTFRGMDYWMFQQERQWLNYTHPEKGSYWKAAKYFGRFNKGRNDKWTFGDKATGAYVTKFGWFRTYRHAMVKGTASPDDPSLRGYWARRAKAKMLMELAPSDKTLARNQNFRCDVCGESLDNGEELHRHHRVPRSRGGTFTKENIVLRHLYCHQQIHHGEVMRSELLEPDARKPARPVLRGGSGGDA